MRSSLSFSVDFTGLIDALPRPVGKIISSPIFWVLTAAAALRLPTLGAENLWYDEAFTVWMARLDLGQMLNALRGDVHPPGWYLVEWLNIRLYGASEFALRLPSALLGIAAVYLLWRLALAVGLGQRTAFVAGLIAAVLPAGLYYSQDARMYEALTCLVLLACWAEVKRDQHLFALAGIGLVYTQNLGWLYVAAIGGVGLVWTLFQPYSQWVYESAKYLESIGLKPVDVTKRRAIKHRIATMIIIMAFYLPWIPSFLHQAQLVSSGFWLQAPNVGTAFWPLMAMTMGTRTGDQFQIHLYLAAVALSLIGLIASRRWLFTRSGLIVLGGALLMPLLALLVSLVWKPIYLHRALLPSAMLFVLFWAYALTHLKPSNRAIALAVAVPMLLVGAVAHYFPAQGGRGFFPDFVQPIREGWRDGDVIEYLAIDATILTHYYLPGYAYALFPEASDLNQSLTNETKDAMGMVQARYEDLRAKGYHRVWIVGGINPLTSQAELDELARLKAMGATLIKSEGTDYVRAEIYRMDDDHQATATF